VFAAVGDIGMTAKARNNPELHPVALTGAALIWK
jgi:hypothetical protein